MIIIRINSLSTLQKFGEKLEKQLLKNWLEFFSKMPSLFIGLFIFSAGIVSNLQAGLGMMPWGVLNVGLVNITPLTLGEVSQLVGLIVLILGWYLGFSPGFGTFVNMCIIGIYIDWILYVQLIPIPTNLPMQFGLLFLSIVFLGIGTLLSEGIGDTIRVSLTSDPVNEIKVGNEILKALGLKKKGIEFISCPTCGRTQINLIKIAEEVEKRLENCKKDIKIAVMGCVVNGPGEARECDLGIAGGIGEGIIFKKGEIIKKVKEEELIDALMEEVEKL